jgi:menaquinone-specific isochorismate synthase
MKFVRERIEPVNRGRLRTLGSRGGWLVETADIIRSGFGGLALSVQLGAGLENHTDARAQLSEHELEGDEGPPGTGIVAFASLPFDRNAPGQLDVPRYVLTQTREGEAWVTYLAGSPPWPDLIDDEPLANQETQAVRTLNYQPTPEEYAHSVALAVEVLRRKEIDKVVLARAVTGSVPESLDAAAIASRLRQREPICTIYSLPTPDGRRFVGASPELLVRRTANAVQCHPLAGTIALPSNVAPDDYHNWLLGSTKNLHEHSVLVDDLVRHLSSLYDDISVDPTPSIVGLRTVAHLGTWVSAVRLDEATAPDALDVLRLLHPTAAVGGIPRQEAYDLIVRLEQNDRGHYAGPVGWMDAEGDGEWWIGIRGVIIQGTEFEAWAGAGIVSESDPIAEREETRDKLASVLSSVLVDRV